MSNEQLLTIYNAAYLSNYSTLTVRNAIRLKQLPAEKIDGKYAIKHTDLALWLGTKGRSIKGGA
jgi:hypothetical protein